MDGDVLILSILLLHIGIRIPFGSSQTHHCNIEAYYWMRLADYWLYHSLR